MTNRHCKTEYIKVNVPKTPPAFYKDKVLYKLFLAITITYYLLYICNKHTYIHMYIYTFVQLYIIDVIYP